jgi:hypothetical protein
MPSRAGNELSQNTLRELSSAIMRPGSFLNGNVLWTDGMHSLVVQYGIPFRHMLASCNCIQRNGQTSKVSPHDFILSIHEEDFDNKTLFK